MLTRGRVSAAAFAGISERDSWTQPAAEFRQPFGKAATKFLAQQPVQKLGRRAAGLKLLALKLQIVARAPGDHQFTTGTFVALGK